MTEPAAAPPLLHVTGLVKVFPGLTALDHVDLDVRPGEIVAIVGHNGSGKSTLVKILSGAYTANAGRISLAPGTELHFIHQDLALVEDLSATENLALARGGGAAALAPYGGRGKSERTRELISRFGPPFDVDCPLRRLSPAQRAIVAISRALDGWTHTENVLVLDEPTESLHRSEVDVLFSAVRRLAADGAGIIFVSHRLDEVLDLADRIVVLRDGVKVADDPVEDVDESRLVELITGADAAAIAHERGATRRGDDEPVLTVRGLHGGSVEHLDLDLRPGEIVGVAGVLGSGREAVPSLLYGATAGTAERFSVAGSPYPTRTPAESIRRGIAFAPADRAHLGMVRELNARENLTLPQLRTLTGPLGRLSLRRERAEAAQLLTDYDVRPPRAEQRISLFSGGNQQKIVMARSLRDRPAVLLLDEPTQGVDIGAKSTIYRALERGAAEGTAVLVSSSDAKELLTICDRVVVMRDGRAAAVLSGPDLTEHRLVAEGYGLPDSPASRPEEHP
ncbi:sugar ABC transporter ATP-binding protein [Microbacterium thalassium]|uniref:Ribose transport system ATP-binding protein n=1 Tax=Microbacterium thalassium TaxID=362649 RepID=A0A7X0FQD4_9MICO|nr:sugar ABC transporter ATP-binding protein [Microbacterium thalassium]MBB6391207.1 ribose transport system ATP-binding protein [Microbacterium thalassium]GLK23683.1 ribose import ATP-binding protein RbsA [Microbacterium thalassium]